MRMCVFCMVQEALSEIMEREEWLVGKRHNGSEQWTDPSFRYYRKLRDSYLVNDM